MTVLVGNLSQTRATKSLTDHNLRANLQTHCAVRSSLSPAASTFFSFSPHFLLLLLRFYSAPMYYHPCNMVFHKLFPVLTGDGKTKMEKSCVNQNLHTSWITACRTNLAQDSSEGHLLSFESHRSR